MGDSELVELREDRNSRLRHRAELRIRSKPSDAADEYRTKSCFAGERPQFPAEICPHSRKSLSLQLNQKHYPPNERICERDAGRPVRFAPLSERNGSPRYSRERIEAEITRPISRAFSIHVGFIRKTRNAFWSLESPKAEVAYTMNEWRRRVSSNKIETLQSEHYSCPRRAPPPRGGGGPSTCCLLSSFWNAFSWIVSSELYPAGSMNGLGLPAAIFAYFSPMLYIAGCDPRGTSTCALRRNLRLC